MNKNTLKTIHPKIYHLYFLHLNALNYAIKIGVKKYLNKKTDLKIPDVGWGDKPYKIFEGKFKEYIGVDIIPAESVDYIAAAEKLPLPDSTFDIVLATQIFEHVKAPQEAIKEIHRVLKKDGLLFLSTHRVWEKHGRPNDFQRWTDNELRVLVSDFRNMEIINNGGAMLCLFQIGNFYLTKSLGIPLLGLASKVMILVNNIARQMLDSIFRKYDFLVINYLVIGKKQTTLRGKFVFSPLSSLG